MYEYRGLQDIIFISLYCGVAFLAVVACLYLLLRRGNAFVCDDFKTSRRLRRRLSQPSRAGVYINNGVVKVNK